MNISLPSSLKLFVDEQVGANSYTSASEYIRELLRLARRREEARVRFGELIQEGIERGPAESFAPDFFDKLRVQPGDHGKRAT